MAAVGAQALRVLVLAPPMSVVGGHSVQAKRLLDALGKQGVEAELLAFPPEAEGVLLRAAQRVTGVRTIANSLTVLWRLARRVRRFDVVHIFSAAYWAMLWIPVPAILVARLLGRPSILNCHDGRAEGMLERWPWTRRLFTLADRVVAPSGYLVGVFRRCSIAAEAVLNSVDAEKFVYRERTSLRPIFLHNRGFEPLYNVACTLRAFAEVQRKHPTARLLAPHDGPLRGELERLADELGLRNVELLGAVSPERMAELYDEADIYWMSPNIDNMPLSVLECYACGLPLISTRVGGVPYIVDDGRTGLLVPPNDHQAMAAAALGLLEDPARALSLARAGRAELAKYLPETVAADWTRIYRELAAARY